jgi:hypothetical protein
MKTPKVQISFYDIIGFIADVQTIYTEHYKTLESKYHSPAHKAISLNSFHHHATGDANRAAEISIPSDRV